MMSAEKILSLRVLSGWERFCGAILFCVLALITSSAQTLTTMVNFDNANGATPVAALVQGVDGKLYGTTTNGGTNGVGTVFASTASGTLTTLHNFANVDGSAPIELLLGANGTFYGLARFGSNLTEGSIFSITSKGKFILLDTFNSPAAFDNSILQSLSGTLYGTTIEGGANGWGSVFEMTPNGTLTTLYSFDCFGLLACPNEAAPSGLAQGLDGNSMEQTPAVIQRAT
jgi:uncharacterized repeat protein (TIGR03803 family)